MPFLERLRTLGRWAVAAGMAVAGTNEAVSPETLVEIAQAFSPRYERHDGTLVSGALVSMDVSGLERLMAPRGAAGETATVWRTIGQELQRMAHEKRVRVHVAVAGTRVAALVLAHARPGLTVVPPGDEAQALAAVPLDRLDRNGALSEPESASVSMDRTAPS